MTAFVREYQHSVRNQLRQDPPNAVLLRHEKKYITPTGIAYIKLAHPVGVSPDFANADWQNQASAQQEADWISPSDAVKE